MQSINFLRYRTVLAQLSDVIVRGACGNAQFLFCKEFSCVVWSFRLEIMFFNTQYLRYIMLFIMFVASFSPFLYLLGAFEIYRGI